MNKIKKQIKKLFGFLLIIIFSGSIMGSENLKNQKIQTNINYDFSKMNPEEFQGVATGGALVNINDGIMKIIGPPEGKSGKYFQVIFSGNWSLDSKMPIKIKFRGNKKGQTFGFMLKDSKNTFSYWQTKKFTALTPQKWQEVTINLKAPWPKRKTKADLSKIVKVVLQIWKPGNMEFAYIRSQSKSDMKAEFAAKEKLTIKLPPLKPLKTIIKPLENVSHCANDMTRIKSYAQSSSIETWADSRLVPSLKGIGYNLGRIINGDVLNNDFKNSHRLNARLDFCKAVGAAPHVILARRIPYHLSSAPLNAKQRSMFGPNDWDKFDNYIKNWIKYVTVTKGHKNAIFEVGNEPEHGSPLLEYVPNAKFKWSKKVFDNYLEIYRHCSNVARDLEKELGFPIMIGGPTGGLAQFGSDNNSKRFIEFCGKNELKLDFYSFHWYGNAHPNFGQSFSRKIDTKKNLDTRVKATRKLLDINGLKNTEIWNTEWGPSFIHEHYFINATNIGAAWCAKFMVDMNDYYDIAGASFLFLNNPSGKRPDGSSYIGWDASMFASPRKFGVAPMATYNVFKMFTMMPQQRVKASQPSVSVGALAARNEKSISILLYNSYYDWRNGPREEGVDLTREEEVTIEINNPEFLGKNISCKQYMVSAEYSNAYGLFQKGEKLDERCELQEIKNLIIYSKNDLLTFKLKLPQSSVTLLVFSKTE